MLGILQLLELDDWKLLPLQETKGLYYRLTWEPPWLMPWNVLEI